MKMDIKCQLLNTGGCAGRSSESEALGLVDTFRNKKAVIEVSLGAIERVVSGFCEGA